MSEWVRLVNNDKAAELSGNIEEDLFFVSKKMEKIRKNNEHNSMDIKQMADFHRYAETLMFLTKSLSILKKTL